jgi:hypothetical protein
MTKVYRTVADAATHRPFLAVMRLGDARGADAEGRAPHAT